MAPFFMQGESNIMQLLKVYLNLIYLFFKIIKNIHKYKSFLLRKSKHGKPANRVLGKTIQGRYMQEIKKASIMSKEDLFIYLFFEALKEEDEKLFKEELETSVILLALWHCEPIKSIEVKKEEPNKKD